MMGSESIWFYSRIPQDPGGSTSFDRKPSTACIHACEQGI